MTTNYYTTQTQETIVFYKIDHTGTEPNIHDQPSTSNHTAKKVNIFVTRGVVIQNITSLAVSFAFLTALNCRDIYYDIIQMKLRYRKLWP